MKAGCYLLKVITNSRAGIKSWQCDSAVCAFHHYAMPPVQRFSRSDKKMEIQASAIMSEPDHNLPRLLGKHLAFQLLFTVIFKAGQI